MKQITGGNIQTPGECSQAVTLFNKWQEFAALSSIAAVRIFAAIMLRVISWKSWLTEGSMRVRELEKLCCPLCVPQYLGQIMHNFLDSGTGSETNPAVIPGCLQGMISFIY
jgi:hypothetical protein